MSPARTVRRHHHRCRGPTGHWISKPSSVGDSSRHPVRQLRRQLRQQVDDRSRMHSPARRCSSITARAQASKYLLRSWSDLVIQLWPHHVVGGTINTIEYGMRGAGAVRPATGYFAGGGAQLKITGLELIDTKVAGTMTLRNCCRSKRTARRTMYGSNYNAPGSLGIYADALDKSARSYIGSSKTDCSGGRASPIRSAAEWR